MVNSIYRALTLIVITLLLGNNIRTCAGEKRGKDTKVVCYLTRSASARSGYAKFSPKHIDTTLCTHIIYAFASIMENFEMTVPAGYRDIMALRTTENNIKILLSVGGATYSEMFEEVVRSSKSLHTFVNKATRKLRDLDFDGLDVDWEYPKSKSNFTSLIKALREEFNKENKTLLLSAAVSPAEKHIENSYEIPNINRYVDFVNLMAYDFHGDWNKIAAFNSPLYPRLSDARFNTKLNQQWAVEKWLESGMSEDKLLLGLAFYGRAYKLANVKQHRVGSPINGAVGRGSQLHMNQIRSYSEVCELRVSGWRYKYDTEQEAAFVYTIDKWVGYDDPFSIVAKTKFALSKNLGGMSVWALEYDDFRGRYCQRGKYPLLKAIHMALTGTSDKIEPDFSMSMMPYWGNMQRRLVKDQPTKTVCYFNNKAQYRDSFIFDMSYLTDFRLCTHLVYAYAHVDDVAYSPMPSRKEDEYGEFQPKRGYVAFNQHKFRVSQTITLLAIGGPDAGTDAFKDISRHSNLTYRFSRNIRDYARKWGFDGIDFVWENPHDKKAHTNVIESLHNVFKSEVADTDVNKLILMVTIPGVAQQHDKVKISRLADLINIRAYNFEQYSSRTLLMAPLHPTGSDPLAYTQSGSLLPWSFLGVNHKVLLGLTAAGLSYRLKSSFSYYIGAAVDQMRVLSNHTKLRGQMAHFEVCEFLKSGATVVYDKARVATYAYKGDLWVSYETVSTIRTKVKYLLERKLGGLTFWSVDLDDFRLRRCNGSSFYPLLEAIYSALPARVSHTTSISTSIATTKNASPGPQNTSTTSVPKIAVTTRARETSRPITTTTRSKLETRIYPESNKPLFPSQPAVIYINGPILNKIVLPVRSSSGIGCVSLIPFFIILCLSLMH